MKRVKAIKSIPELLISINMNIFEKNPTKGGTPAMDKRAIVMDLVKRVFNPLKLIACIVLVSGAES